MTTVRWAVSVRSVEDDFQSDDWMLAAVVDTLVQAMLVVKLLKLRHARCYEIRFQGPFVMSQKQLKDALNWDYKTKNWSYRWHSREANYESGIKPDRFNNGNNFRLYNSSAREKGMLELPNSPN